MAQVKSNNRISKILHVLDSLRVDRVYSYAQVERHFGVHPKYLQLTKELFHFHLLIKPQAKSSGHQKLVSFVTLEKNMHAKLLPSQIGHLSGTAEMRLMLEAPLDEWHNDAAALGKSFKPDAVWKHPQRGEIAIEFDAGSYVGKLIERKLQAFQHHPEVIWGVTGDYRFRRLVRKFANLKVKVVQSMWWDLPPDWHNRRR